MKKQQLKAEMWQELNDCQAEIISGGLQKLQQEFAPEFARSSKPKEIVVVGSRIS